MQFKYRWQDWRRLSDWGISQDEQDNLRFLVGRPIRQIFVNVSTLCISHAVKNDLIARKTRTAPSAAQYFVGC